MTPVSLIYGGIPGYAIFWALIVIAVGLFLFRTYRLWRYMMLGHGWGELAHLPRRVLVTLLHVVGQWCQFKSLSRKDISSLGHVFMAWGFFIFIVYYGLFIIIGDGFGISRMMENNRFFLYYSWIMDLVAPLVIIAALWGIIRRYILRPSRLKGEQTLEAAVILISVGIHPVTHLFKEATGIALGQFPVVMNPGLPIIGSRLSQIYIGNTLSSVQNANIGFFWAHWSIVLFVLVYISYSRYLHMLAAPFNILLRPSGPRVGLNRSTLKPRKILASLTSGILAGSRF